MTHAAFMIASLVSVLTPEAGVRFGSGGGVLSRLEALTAR